MLDKVFIYIYNMFKGREQAKHQVRKRMRKPKERQRLRLTNEFSIYTVYNI